MIKHLQFLCYKKKITLYFIHQVVTAASFAGAAGAACQPSDNNTQRICGEFHFKQANPGFLTLITYRVTGLSPGAHGLHIHEFADYSSGCSSLGPIYNPYFTIHGNPYEIVGGLPNIIADAAGVAKGSFRAPTVQLSGDISVIGRAVMVHQLADDYTQVGLLCECSGLFFPSYFYILPHALVSI